MGDIKLSRNELLQQARRVSNIKDEIDKILRETTNTYNVLNRVSEVSTWSARRDLDNVRSAANKASRDLGSLCTSINSAIRIYDQKEKELNKLAEIKKKNLASNSIRKDQNIVSSYPIGKNITFKTNNTKALGNLNKAKSILKIDVNKVGNMVGVGTAVSINAVSNIIAVKGNELGGLIGKALSKLSNFDIKNITGVKPIKNNVIKPLLKVATVPINLLGNVVNASNKIVSVAVDKFQSQLDKVKNKVNEIWNSIPNTIEKLKNKVTAKGKELLDGLKGVVDNLKEGFFNFLNGCKNFIVGAFNSVVSILASVVNVLAQALIGIVAGSGYLIGMIFDVPPNENSFSKWVETWRGGVNSFFEWVAPNDTVYNVTNSILDMAVSCIPVVGDIRDVVEVLTGVNMMTGEELSLLERGVTLACMFLPIVGASFVRESGQGIVKFIGKHWDEAVQFVSKYTDDFVGLLSKYTDDVLMYVAKKGDEGLTLLKKVFNFGDEIEFAGVGTFKGDPEVSTKLQDFVSKISGKVDDVSSGTVKSVTKASKNITDIINKHGLTIDKFNELRIKDTALLTDSEKKIMKSIRDSIEMPNNTTTMQKVIPLDDISKYLDGTYTQVGGYVTKYEDVSNLSKYEDIYESLRLDYPGTAYKVDSDSSLGVIRFKTPDSKKIGIPYGVDFGGTITDSPPFTGNGFTKAMNGNIIPEFKCSSFLDVYDGAELYQIDKNGVETLIAIFSEIDGKFMPIK